jgi:hypothetical protein
MNYFKMFAIKLNFIASPMRKEFSERRLGGLPASQNIVMKKTNAASAGKKILVAWLFATHFTN